MTSLAFDDNGGQGRLVVMLPGAGDLRSEYRFLAPLLPGYRVVTADLPGHGDSVPAREYTVATTATALISLIESIDAGPAVVVACSFAPAAAVWAAVERPDLIEGIVALSPHFTSDDSFKGRMLSLATKGMLRGPWAGGLWSKLYASWYKKNPPADLEAEVGRLRVMLGMSDRRRAVRNTLTADRDGVADRMTRVGVPTLSIFGSLDDHFVDPTDEADQVATALGGDRLVVEGTGHYPHVERPDLVADAVSAFLSKVG